MRSRSWGRGWTRGGMRGGWLLLVRRRLCLWYLLRMLLRLWWWCGPRVRRLGRLLGRRRLWWWMRGWMRGGGLRLGGRRVGWGWLLRWGLAGGVWAGCAAAVAGVLGWECAAAEEAALALVVEVVDAVVDAVGVA